MRLALYHDALIQGGMVSQSLYWKHALTQTTPKTRPVLHQVLECEGAAAEAGTAERGVRTALLGAQQRLSEALQITAALGHHLRQVRCFSTIGASTHTQAV
jgi:hypothetical protein